jgi:hypothetical protein
MDMRCNLTHMKHTSNTHQTHIKPTARVRLTCVNCWLNVIVMSRSLLADINASALY